MLKVPLESHKSRKNSVSSIGDDSFDPRRMTEIIDDQNRLIRKLKHKISKLESTLERKKEENTKIKGSASPLGSHCLELDLLKAEMERTNLLEDNVDRVNSTVGSILAFLSQESSPKIKYDLPTATSCKSIPPQEKDYLEISAHQEIDKKIEMLLNNLAQLDTKVKGQRNQLLSLENQNQHLKSQMRNRSQLSLKDSLELQQLKYQYQSQRKRCAKFKSLLEKSQYERNNMVTQMHKNRAQEKKKGKTYQDLVCLSESLNGRVKDLQIEKQKLAQESLKEQEKWKKHYKQLLNRLKAGKKKDYH